MPVVVLTLLFGWLDVASAQSISWDQGISVSDILPTSKTNTQNMSAIPTPAPIVDFETFNGFKASVVDNISLDCPRESEPVKDSIR